MKRKGQPWRNMNPGQDVSPTHGQIGFDFSWTARGRAILEDDDKRRAELAHVGRKNAFMRGSSLAKTIGERSRFVKKKGAA